MDNPKTTTEAQAIQDIVIRSAPVTVMQDHAVPFKVLPPGCEVNDLEDYLPSPTRKRGTINLYDVNSFIEVFKIHKIENSHIYYNKEKCTINAVFNDDAINSAGWKDHQAIYKCPLSSEWKTWSGNSGRQQNQNDFAEFLENNLPDIYSNEKGQPTAAQLLEVATNFKINKKVNFSSAKRLDNGQVSFEYVEAIEGTGGAKGHIKVPEKFWIAIPIFENGSIYQLECRLKYRLKEGQLFMWFDLYRSDKARDAAFADVLKTVSDGCGINLFAGEI